MNNEERIAELARRGQEQPESLTEDEIREVCLAALINEQGGDFPKGEVGNQN